jgi:hypothetical protein
MVTSTGLEEQIELERCSLIIMPLQVTCVSMLTDDEDSSERFK